MHILGNLLAIPLIVISFIVLNSLKLVWINLKL